MFEIEMNFLRPQNRATNYSHDGGRNDASHCRILAKKREILAETLTFFTVVVRIVGKGISISDVFGA